MSSKRFLPIFCLLISGLFFPLHAKNVDSSLEESLELRRISEYWKEKDYTTAKTHIREFLNKNPKSAFLDQLYAMLGDLDFQEKNYKDAANSYDKIIGKEFRQKCLFQRLHSLYEIGKHEEFILSSELFLKDPHAKTEELNIIHFELAEAYFQRAHAPENDKKKKELLRAALSEYQQLMQTKFADLTWLPQAQIYAYFEDYPKAASLYLLLSHQNVEKKEEYLFQAASFQLHTDKKSAIDTFGAIGDLNGKYASKAAFNQLNLLFQEKRYRDFILAQDKALKHISQEKLPLIQYYLGKSFFQTKDFSRAIDPLSQSLAAKNLDRTQQKSALLTLIVCAQETRDLPLFEKTLAHLKADFAGDEETGNILLMHAQLCRDKHDFSKARSDFKELLELSPQHPQREALLYDNALLLSQEGKWQDAALAFDSFIREFPNSAHKADAVRHLINCRLDDVKHASKETESIKKEQLLLALGEALSDKKTFSQTERQKLHYLQGKTHFELGQYDEAIGELSEYVRDFQKDPTCADAYLLLAYAYQKGSRDEIHFVLNAEKALALNPKLQGALDLHLTLFNSYLSLAGKVSANEKGEMIEKGANHLFLAMDKPIHKENQRWLASYFYQNHSFEKAAIALEKLLGIRAPSYALSIPSDSLDMEGEVIKLATIYAKTERWPQRAKLLEALMEQYKIYADAHWKYQRMTSFELGKAYLSLNEKEKALHTFKELISSSSHISSYYAIAAQLELAKLEFSLLKDIERTSDSKPVAAICDTLKEIQIKRKLHSEPLHLEAALCYIDIKSSLAAQNNSHKRMLLEQMKESFSAKDDPLVKEYFSAAMSFPDKERLYRQYMDYIDAEIAALQAQDSHDPALMKQAQEKWDKLLTQTSDDALKQRIAQSRQEEAR